MRKLFFTILLAGLAIMLVSWSFAGQTKVDQESSATSVKAERAKSDAAKAVTGQPLSTQNKTIESNAPAYKTGTAGNNGQNADPSLDKTRQEAIRAEQAAEEKAKMDSQREKQSLDMPEALKIEEATAPVQETPAQAEPAKWQPIYGSKGELLNAEPSVQIATYDKGYEPSMLLTNLFSETFETAWDTTGVDHPINWTNNDNGNAGTRFWSVDDWHKYNYSSWGSNCARVNYYPNAETTYNEWLISPAVALTGGATACSLTWRNYYSNYTSTLLDSAIIKISSDNGATWVDSLRWGTTQAAGYKKIDLTSYAGQSVKVAFVCKVNGNPYTNSYTWYLDDVKFFADATTLLNENFETWGPGGDLPPTSWTILDSGAVKISGGYNLNDWQRYSASWGGYAARVYYASSPYDPEWQNEELITPAISISSGVACSLGVAEYYYRSTSTPFENLDHGYILVSTNGGTTWPETLVNHTATIGTTSTKTIYKYSLNGHAGQSIMLKFKFVNSPIGSSYWIFDDVSVDETVLLAHDVATASLVAPTLLVQGYSSAVTSRVANAGTNTETFQDSVKIGLTVKDTLLVEKFSNPQSWTGALPPVNALGTWAILDSGKAGWSVYDWHAYYNSTWLDTVARVNYASNDTGKSWLISPSINCTGKSAVHFTFKTYYWDEGATYSDTAWMYGTDDNWATSHLIAMWNETHGSSTTPEYPDFDISSWAANKANVKIAFKYVGIGSAPWYWYVDNVLVYNLATPSLAYSARQTVTGLASLAQTNVNFSNFTPAAAGDYLIKTFTALTTDLNRANDTISSAKTSYSHTGTGGPDAGYYNWADNINGSGPAFAWKDISSIGTQVTYTSTTGDDRYTLPIPMGFSFYHYGNSFTKICVAENGFCSFDSLSSGPLGNTTIPTSSTPNNLLSLLWDDLKQSTGNVYFYTNNVDTCIVSYVNCKWYGADSVNSFSAQMILSATDHKIKFQYQNLGPAIPTTHTIGIESGTGTVGLQYYYNSTPAGNLALPGLAITFTYNPPSHDITATTIVAPIGTILKNANFTPKSVFVNNGGFTETAVPVYFNIYDSTGSLVYNNSQAIASIAATAVDTVSFAATSLSVNGTYRCTTYVALPGDVYPSNDKKTGTFVIDSHRSTGGPDAYYYKYIDNFDSLPPLILRDMPHYSWIELNPDSGGSGISMTPTVDSTYDDRAYIFPIGFSFNYYGLMFDSAYASTNGLVTFGAASTAYSNYAIPTSGVPDAFIAPFWDDLYLTTRSGSRMYYYQAGTYTVIEWFMDHQSSSDSLDATKYLSFEVILHQNGDIVIQYKHVATGQTDYAGELATVGVESPILTDDAVYGVQYLCNGVPALNLLRNDLAILFYRELPTHDIATSSFIGLSPVGVVNAPVVPQVVFANNGRNDEASVPVRLLGSPGAYNNTQTAVIDSGARDTVSFTAYTPTTAGVCTLTAIAELGADVARNNDTLKFYYTVYDTVIDFEANAGGLLNSGSWGDFLGDWEYGTPSVVGPAAPHSGSYCWGTIIDGYRTRGATYGGIRSWLDLQINVGSSHNATFGFYEWYNTTSSDTMHVFVDTGAGWMSAYVRNGYYTSTAWTQYSINLSAYTGIVKLRFDYYSNSAYDYAGWYLDDFTFTHCTPFYPAHDMATQLILAPNGAGAKNVAIAPKVIFKNNATAIENSVPVRVLITQGGYNNAQTIASIGSMGMDTITFANFTPTVAGICTVTAIVTLGTDVDRSNDTLVAYYQVFDQVIDFESTNGGFQTGGGPDWQYGVPNYASGPATAHSVSNCWGTNLTGPYTIGTVSDLMFEVSVGATGTATFGMYQWYYYESSYDGGDVSISTDNGASWIILHPAEGYTGLQNSSNPLPGADSIFTGSAHNYWHPVSFDLTAYNGQIIAVKLASGADAISVQYAGWYVDDFAFLNCSLYLPAHDIQVSSIDAPYNQLIGGQTYSVTATIKNKGANTETFTVKASDNHGYNNTQTVTAMPSLSSRTVTFPSWSITGCTSYVMTVVAQLGTDVNRTNDTLQKSYDSYNPAGYNFVGYDSPGIENATYMYSPSNLFAAQFDVTSPATGALIKAIEFKFLTVGDPFWPWPDAVHDRIQGYIFVDGDNNGIPDATPLFVDTLLSADSGWTVWPIDCAEALRACNTTRFWAGVSSADSAHNEGIALDSVLDYRDMYWKRISGAWVIDSAATGDKLIRASYDTSSVGSVHIAIGSLTAVGSATKPASDTVSNTIDNTGSGCDMSYSATVIQDTPFRPRHDYGNIQPNSIRQSPMGFATTADAKGTRTEPYYPPQTLRAGGPDAYGYKYKDSDEVGGPTFGWVDITGTGTALNLTDDDVEKVAVGFSFPFYGNTYDSIYVISNGYLGFGVTSSDFSNDSIPNSSTPNNLIAIWWDDLNADSLPNIFYKYDSVNNVFIVSYVGVPNYNSTTDTTGSLTFQAILYPNGNIKTQYLSMIPGNDSLTEATIGIENATGTTGLQVVYNQAYMADSLAILYTAPIFWLSTDLTSGTLDPASPAMPFNIFMQSADLDAGTYLGRVIVTSNDQSNPSVTINVSFTVTGGGGGDCDYLIGDISGDGQRLGGDVTYGVRYFKGVGATPKDSCLLDSTGAYMYVAGDCNGNCEFRGSDITRLVAYFKGIAHLSCCHWFPTTLPPIILRTDPTPIQQTNPGTAVVPRNDDQAIIGTQKTTR
jgi:hypothetical protein